MLMPVIEGGEPSILTDRWQREQRAQSVEGDCQGDDSVDDRGEERDAETWVSVSDWS